MRLRATLSVSCVLTLILGSAFPGLAGQPPSCIKAASSKNGNFLVLMNMQLDPPQSKDGVTMSFSFEIFPKENFLNAKDRLTTPGAYFSGGSWAQWGVALDSRNGTDGPFTSFCPLPLVTDDGEFLILLAQTPAWAGSFGGCGSPTDLHARFVHGLVDAVSPSPGSTAGGSLPNDVRGDTCLSAGAQRHPAEYPACAL